MKPLRALVLCASLLCACGVAPVPSPLDGAAEGSLADGAHEGSLADADTLDGAAIPDGVPPLDGSRDSASDGAPARDVSLPDAAPPDAPPACAAGHTMCGASCVDEQTDEANCGRCGARCVAGERCTAGHCVDANGCTPLQFPSVSIRTVPAPASVLSLYSSISDSSCFPMPRCFIDTANMLDADTGARLTLGVQVSTNFTLSEFVHTDLDMGYGPYVLLSPALVARVQRLREVSGRALSIASGYRSPAHQRAVCRSICPGGADCCPSASHPCGCRSRHEWGDAADLSIAASDYSAYATYSMRAGLPDCLLEAGSFHVDTSPCPLGCPYNF